MMPPGHRGAPRWGACCALLATLLPLIAGPAVAAAGGFLLPIDCDPGMDCWIVNYVDLDAGAGAADHRCGRLTYDGHKGTDFAVRDLAAMAAGVAVLAVADGVVVAVRDDEPEGNVRQRGLAAVKDRECGNGVRVDHGNGLTTQYCHLRQGSVRVRRGDAVRAGQPLGAVGLSGQTEFPHIHLTVYRDGKVVDPFIGRPAAEGCTEEGESLWEASVQDRLPYGRRQIYNLGIAGEEPVVERVRAGAYWGVAVPANAPLLAVWMEAFGLGAGDRVRLELKGPTGEQIVRSEGVVEREFIRGFRWAARRAGDGPWAAGKYQVAVEIVAADGGAPSRATAVVEVSPTRRRDSEPRGGGGNPQR